MLPYILDIKTGLVHKSDCKMRKSFETVNFKKFKPEILKNYKPCSCCQDEYYKALKERNLRIRDKSGLNYFYSFDSNIYHKYSCDLILKISDLNGVHSFEQIQKLKLEPCKICKPTKDDEKRPVAETYKNDLLHNSYKVPHMSKNELKAIKRQQIAKEERNLKLNDSSLTDKQREDIKILTQSSFIFFAAKGYNNFHLRDCNSLQNLTEIKGFRTYAQAIKAGYTPCKKCKPSSKHNLNSTIPINSEIRVDESIEDLKKYCKKLGYSFSLSGCDFKIETPVGKWIVDISSLPIKVKHINLDLTPYNNKYHNQPRVFLSYIDVITYIKNHDKKLVNYKKKVKNIND